MKTGMRVKFTAIFQKCQVGADARGLFLCLPVESDTPETQDTPKRNRLTSETASGKKISRNS